MLRSSRDGGIRARRVSGRGSARGSGRGSGRGFGTTERLEPRTLLSAQWPGAVVGVTPGSTAAGSAPALMLVDHDGGAEMVREYSPIYPIGAGARRRFVGPVNTAALAAPRPAARATGGLDIVLNKGPNLLANPAASAAFDRAAAFFEARFHDPITVVIDAEIDALGANTLGEATSVRMGDTFDTVRDYIVRDADPDEAFVSQLPDEASFYSTLPDSSYSITGASANRANLLALGVPASELDFGPDSEYDPSMKQDASITFSSQFPFDFNPDDGIAAGKSDFVGVATHEIAHALGFVSVVDEVDNTMTNGGTGNVAPTPLDLFRFQPGAGGFDFAGGTRVLSPGSVVQNQVFYDGGLFDPSGILQIAGLATGDIPFSTGTSNGDSWQASHWKDDQFIGGVGHTIGMMDPLAPHGVMTWTAADDRAMGLIGWDTAAPALLGSISGTVFQDDDADGVHDATEPGLPDWTVYQDLNNNGQLDVGTVAEGTGPARDILDGQNASSTFDVSGVAGSISNLKVILDITHTYVDDLTATLVSPSGTRITLFHELDLPLFVSHENFEGTTFDDNSPWAIDDPQSSPPFTAAYRPQQPLSLLDGEDPNGQWELIVHDGFEGDEGTLNSWSIEFDSAEPSARTDANGDYAFTELPARTYTVRQVVQDGYTQTTPAGNAARVIDLGNGEEVSGEDFGDSHGAPPAQVVGRHLFYNNSALDGNDARPGAADDAAVAATRSLAPGDGTATYANYSTYSRGLNGLMIDVKNLPAAYVPAASDFAFAAGNSGSPATWQPVARQPSSVTVRRGVDPDGDGDTFDRITIIWPDNAIKDQWLKVTVPAGGNLGLSDADVFFFGHLAGDTGFPSGVASVNAIDFQRVRRALGQTAAGANADSDFNHNGRIDATDLAAVKANMGRSLNRTIAAAAPAPAAASVFTFSEVPVTAAAAMLQPSRVWDESTGSVLA
jgi:subtilisin-like proprotein convertase family protein